MHELSIAHGLVETCLGALRDAGPVRVVSVRVRVGAVSGVVPESLAFAFEACIPGTALEGARLEIEPVEARLICRGCGVESLIEERFSMLCPACGGLETELVAGRELRLESMEVE